MRIFLSVFILLISGHLHAQEAKKQLESKNIQTIKSFVNDLANNNKAVDIILSNHLIVENPSDELYDYLEVSLQEVRLNLLSKKLEDIVYTPFANMPRKDTKDIDPEGLNTNNMYFINYKNRQILAVYLENGKIASFTLVSKGNNQAHFVLY